MLINKQDVTVLKRLNSKAKILVIALLTCAFSIGLGLPIFLGNKQPAENKVNLSPTTTPFPVNLSLQLTNKTIKTGEPFSVDINISTPNQTVDAADAVIYFDPTILKAEKISNGDFFQTTPVKRIEKNYVKISAAATLNNNKIIFPQGNGNIGTITFLPIKKTNETLIYFDPENTIVAKQGENITGALTDLVLSVK